jgi:NAD-dependent SIR2 family protein deacetylase
MTKTWKCTQCGNAVDKGILASIRGAPTECNNCGNTGFEDPITLGSFHKFIDKLLN